MATLSPSPKLKFFTNANVPAAGYRLYTYQANTTTPLATYADPNGTTPNTNPIVLDARGEATIYLSSGQTYDYVLKTGADAIEWGPILVTPPEGTGSIPDGGTTGQVLARSDTGVEWQTPVGDSGLRTDLQATTTGKGADLVAFPDPVAPSYLKVTSDILAGLPVHAKRFLPTQATYTSILDGSVTYDAGDKLQEAVLALCENRSRRGGVLDLGRGKWKSSKTLRPTSYATDNSVNLTIRGEGILATQLDFSGMVRGGLTGDMDAIVVANDQNVILEGFFLVGGGIGATKARDGIHLGRIFAEGGTYANAASMVAVRDVRVQGFARDGLHNYNTYRSNFEGVFSIANGRDGFHGEGFHTSLNHVGCWARANFQDPTTFATERGAGFRFNGMVYSTFTGCASDDNEYGYILTNARGVSFIGCGAEGSGRDSWYVYADNGTVDTLNTLMVQECYDVNAVSLINCTGFGGSAGSAGYAGLVRVKGANVHTGAGTLNNGSAHKVKVSVRDCYASVGPNSAKAILADQASGGSAEIILEGNNDFPGGMLATNSAKIRNRSLNGKRCVAGTTTAASIDNSTDTLITWDTSPTTSDDIGAYSSSAPTRLTVPAGVSRIRLKARVGWASNATGSRRLIVYKNGAVAASQWPRAEQAVAGAFNTTMEDTSPILDVVAGDYFEMYVQQSSGGALAINAPSTFLEMEVIE